MNTLSQTIVNYCRLFVRGINENDVRIFLESSPQYPNLLSVVQTFQYANLHIKGGKCDWDYLNKDRISFLASCNFAIPRDTNYIKMEHKIKLPAGVKSKDRQMGN